LLVFPAARANAGPAHEYALTSRELSLPNRRFCLRPFFADRLVYGWKRSLA
jgi:hypothetical protein